MEGNSNIVNVDFFEKLFSAEDILENDSIF